MKKWLYISLLLVVTQALFGQNKQLDKGIKFYNEELYVKALAAFDKAGNPTEDLNLCFYQARTNHILQNLDTAFYFYSILENAKNKDAEFLINYADLCIELGKYDKAKRSLRKLLAAEPNNTKAKVLLASCESVEVLNENPNFLLANPLKINTDDDDFSPFLLTENQLIFCSNRGDENSSKSFGRDDTRFINLYESNQKKVTGFDNASGLQGLNGKWHEGPVCYDKVTKELYFTRSVKVAHAELGYSYTLAIFKSTFNGEFWSKPTEFEYNIEGYSVGHPAISNDGKTLYFISDQPGGLGKTDIYVCNRNGTSWSSPVNLKSLNTPENEMFPTILKNGALSFATNGRVGLGGLDIYIFDNDSLYNPGRPINSSRDDFGLISTDDENLKGYFSSNRTINFGGDNIFSYKPIAILVSGYLNDSISNKAVKEGKWRIIDSEGNIQDFEVSKKGFFSSPLKPEEKYTFQFTAPNYNMKQVPFSTKNLKGDLDTLLNIGLSRGVTPTIEGVVVDEADTIPVAGAKVKLTDIAKGNSESLETDTTGYYIFFVDSTKQYELNIDHPLFLVSTIPVQKIENKLVPKTEFNLEIKTVSIAPIILNKPLEIENIYYDYDKYDITPTSASILDTLYNLMLKNEDIVVELSSHTDVRGSDEYNEVLSEQRAKAAMTYLVAKGIDEYRLVFKFYGKTELAVPCPSSGECPESVHKLNRRTEFRIVGY
jgi:outer membrane protein OmpA-like peptidoglycan-associated protein/tetratricopeptide (TPR) repeat protein